MRDRTKKDTSEGSIKPSYAILILFGLGALICLSFGYFSLTSVSSITSGGVEVEGKVVEIVSRYSQRTSGGTSTDVFAPKVSFTASDGKEYTFISENYTSNSSYSVGDKVSVVYQPSDPTRAIINSFFQTWLLPIVLLSLGAVFALIAGLALYWIINGARILGAAEKTIAKTQGTKRVQDAEKLFEKVDKSANS